jgi:hypothetical protein
VDISLQAGRQAVAPPTAETVEMNKPTAPRLTARARPIRFADVIRAPFRNILPSMNAIVVGI